MSLGAAVYIGNAMSEPVVSVESYWGVGGDNNDVEHTKARRRQLAALTSEKPPVSNSCPAPDS